MRNLIVTVLLVEDSPSDAELIKEGVSAEDGFVVSIATCLKDALADMDRRGTPDAILLDLGLPDSQGLDTLRAVTRQADKVPIIVLTGRKDKELGIEAVRIGADDYLHKGTDPSGLGELVRRAISYAIERRALQAKLAASEVHRRARREMAELEKLDSTARPEGALRDRTPGKFLELVDRYGNILAKAVDMPDTGVQGDLLEVGRELGALGAGPKDVVDIHRAALQGQMSDGDADRTSALVNEGHLTSIGLMGMLVEYYRG